MRNAASRRGLGPRPSKVADFAVGAGALLVIFLVVEVLLSRGSISFTGPLNLVGTLTLPLLAGVFPMLLLVAARRRGDRLPGRMIGFPDTTQPFSRTSVTAFQPFVLPSRPVHQVAINTPAQRNHHAWIEHREVVEPAPESRVHATREVVKG